jgi:hypothetical protein
MTGTNCDVFTHNYSRSYLNHLVILNWILEKWNGEGGLWLKIETGGGLL